MISHQRCKNCYQKKSIRGFNSECPSRPAYGHQWETISGNGVSWNESLVGKLWKTKYGKVIVIALGLILIMMLS
jgi:hypothetical protein